MCINFLKILRKLYVIDYHDNTLFIKYARTQRSGKYKEKQMWNFSRNQISYK